MKALEKYKDPAIKGIAELVRVAIVAILPLLILYLETGEIDPRVIGVTAGIAIMRALDKMIHKYGEQTGNELLKRGITQF